MLRGFQKMSRWRHGASDKATSITSDAKKCAQRMLWLESRANWFYDIFICAVTGSARWSSFIEEGFDFLVASYG
jgi:hypothetical protein